VSTVPYLLVGLPCLLYTAINVTRGIPQRRYARETMLHPQQDPASEAPRGVCPSVDVLVPCYNEDPELLDECLTSLANQDYQGQLRVFVVDDGSRNRGLLHPVMERHGQRPGWQIVLLSKNVGKRRAMDAALQLGDSEIVITLDSDTVIRHDELERIVMPLAEDTVGVVSGSLKARNAGRNWLTRQINLDYTRMFYRERAAQGRFRTLLCCCGAFAAYRRTALDKVWDRHLSQTFGGKLCSTGDDLHLTLELLANGYDAVLQPDAVAATHVPDTLGRYARQQRRWSRSFIRELPLAIRAIVHRPRWGYLALDLAVETYLPVLLAIAVALAPVQWLLYGPSGLAGGLGLLAATVLLTSVASAIRARDLRYLLYAAVVYHFVVVPGFLVSLISVGRDSWATRELPPLVLRS
jgi:N-acetylglucosaminyltransferase